MDDGDDTDDRTVEAIPSDERDFAAGARGASVDNDLLYGRAGGLFRTLERGSIAEYLEPDEQPHYVFQNRVAGVTVEQPEGTVERAPSRRYRAFLVVTDRRVLFLVGRTDGDERTAVPYAAITNVSRSGGLLHEEVRINTGSGLYVFEIEKTASDREIDAAIDYIAERAAGADGGADPTDAPTVDRARRLVREARDDSVTMDRLTARDGELLGLLAPDEQPHYYFTGSGHRGIEVEDADGDVVRHGQADASILDSLDQLDRENRTVVTDRRVLAYLPKTTGTVEYAVAITDLTEAAIEPGEGGLNPRLAVSTGDRALRLEVHADQRERLERALGYVRTEAELGDGNGTTSGPDD